MIGIAVDDEDVDADGDDCRNVDELCDELFDII